VHDIAADAANHDAGRWQRPSRHNVETVERALFSRSEIEEQFEYGMLSVIRLRELNTMARYKQYDDNKLLMVQEEGTK